VNRTKEAIIRQGVRQDCLLSPYLFNTFIETAITETKEKTPGIRINGKQIHSICFADDIALVANTEEELNKMLNSLDSKLIKYKLKINANKTKAMIVSKIDNDRTANIKVRNETISLVNEFCYLDSLITHDNKLTKEIKRHNTSKTGLQKEENSLYKHLSVESKKNFIKTHLKYFTVWVRESDAEEV